MFQIHLDTCNSVNGWIFLILCITLLLKKIHKIRIFTIRQINVYANKKVETEGNVKYGKVL